MANEPNTLLRITKYPNRRYYDTTRSCNVTLDDLHRLVCEGRELQLVDSKTGDDITNAVLIQMILDRDPPKLELLPPALLHHVIRSNRQVLRAYFDRFTSQMVTGFVAYQEQVDRMMKESAGANPMMGSAFDWTNSMMQFFMPNVPSSVQPGTSPTPDPQQPPADASPAPEPTAVADSPDPPQADHAHDVDAIAELRAQLTELQTEVKKLRPKTKSGRGRTPKRS